jgi:DNA-binding MarR family transcriptional regulator
VPETRSAIQREIRQSRPFRSPAAECLVGLFRTADALKRRLASVIGTAGITLQQYNVLRILRGSAEGGLPTLEIACRMVEHAPGITRLLGRLEGKGLVRRRRAPEDRREVRCWITPQGLALLAGLEEEIHRGNQDCLSPLDRGEIRELIRLMDAIRTGLPPCTRGDRTREHSVKQPIKEERRK